MSMKVEYQNKLQEELDQLKAQIAKLTIMAEDADVHSHPDILNEIKELNAHKDTAQQRLDDIQAAEENNWMELKVSIEKTWHDLEEAVKAASARFTGK